MQKDRRERFRYSNVTIVSSEECLQKLDDYQRPFVTEHTVCVDRFLNDGDDGTALINGTNGKVMAIASLIFYYAARQQPDIYLQVTPYLKWILEHVESDTGRNKILN